MTARSGSSARRWGAASSAVLSLALVLREAEDQRLQRPLGLRERLVGVLDQPLDLADLILQALRRGHLCGTLHTPSASRYPRAASFQTKPGSSRSAKPCPAPNRFRA